MGAMILFAAIFLVVFLIAMLLGVVLLKRRGSGTHVPTGSGAADFGKPDNWQPPVAETLAEDGRDQFLRNLGQVGRGVNKFYIVFVCFLMAAITGVAVFLYLSVPAKDPNRDFLILYGGGLYIAGMLWGCTQLTRAMRRISGSPSFPMSLATPRIHVKFQTTPQMEFIGNDALDRAQKHLDAGGSIEEACALADPKYNSMNAMMQKIFQAAIQASIDERRKMQH